MLIQVIPRNVDLMDFTPNGSSLHEIQLIHEPRGEHRLYEKSQFQAIYRVQNIEPEARHLIPHFTVITKTMI